MSISSKNIISASRRTDIPAFYAEWFMNRIREGFVLAKNPFNASQIQHVSLLQKDVLAIIFWTRNPKNLLSYLWELEQSGFHFYFHYTITGFPRQLEPSVPDLERSIATFRSLSEMIGPERVIWRFDPILFSSMIGMRQHIELFDKISKDLQGWTKRVVISFADIYAKVKRNMAKIPIALENDQKKILHFSQIIGAIAQDRQMEISSCAEEIDLSTASIGHGRCVDGELLQKLFSLEIQKTKDKGQRRSCLCVKSIDIGQYNSCLHGCLYCYATSNHDLARKNFQRHDPNSSFLVG